MALRYRCPLPLPSFIILANSVSNLSHPCVPVTLSFVNKDFYKGLTIDKPSWEKPCPFGSKSLTSTRRPLNSESFVPMISPVSDSACAEQNRVRLDLPRIFSRCYLLLDLNKMSGLRRSPNPDPEFYRDQESLPRLISPNAGLELYS